MKRSATNLARALEMLWYLSMGLFLGLTGGLVLAVILTFRGARAIDATPGAPPFSDPRFADVHNDAVAGYIGQELFMVGGSVAFTLLWIAIAIRIAFHISRSLSRLQVTGSRLASQTRNLMLAICFIAMSNSSMITMGMNEDWPKMYDLQADQEERQSRREAFEVDHQDAERSTSIAWLAGLFALGVSPWCRRVADIQTENASSPKQ